MTIDLSAQELEQVGDDAHAAGRAAEALEQYREASHLFCKVLLDVTTDHDSRAEAMESLRRVSTKSVTISRELNPPKSPEVKAEELRDAITESVEAGNLVPATLSCIRLGEILTSIRDDDGAESAYRQAVALARQIDSADPELMLHAFTVLADFLSPSEESINLAQEMARNLINRDDMYHPMRAAEAAYRWAVAELDYARISHHRVDHTIDGITRKAIEAVDSVCFHRLAQNLQWQVVELLEHIGRDTDVAEWREEAEKYEDWNYTTDQVIPGHVHLWDIRGDMFIRDEDD